MRPLVRRMRRHTLHLSPSPFPIDSSQALQVANACSCCDRLENGDFTDDLKVHSDSRRSAVIGARLVGESAWSVSSDSELICQGTPKNEALHSLRWNS